MMTLTQARVALYRSHGRHFELIVPGAHNQFNCQAAWTAAEALGVWFDDAQQAVRDFPGLPHRLQLVHEANGIRWFNDSIATIPDAAIAALNAFPPRTVLQIVGGSDKGIPFIELAQALSARAKAILCIGATGKKIAKLVAESRTEGWAPTYHCVDLRSACRQARGEAMSGDVVLLSTGCASYDQFDNFEDRGEQFIKFARHKD
jgi:UDP-N-acetylmuramoylalanine--D-glutamate ligase